MASKKPPASSGKSATAPKASAKKASPKKASTKAAPRASTAAPKKAAPTRAPAKKASPRATGRGKPVMSPVKKPRTWGRAILVESIPVALGVVAGLALTGALLWNRATDDVTTYLAAPPPSPPIEVWSAPIEVRRGQQASVEDIAEDLVRADYERVETLTGPDQFSVTDGHVEVWTAPRETPVPVLGGRAEITVRDGVVTATRPTDGAILAPTRLATLGDLESRRTPVSLDELAPWVEPALLAMEDRRFREHKGIDPLGILRAVLHNLRATGGGWHGGSTLTQQLAKNLFTSSDRTLQRKVREAFFATALERTLTKNQILELYLGEVYLGQIGGVPVYGVEQAARGWFGVSASRLTPAQTAMIIGVIPSPNGYNPARHPEKAKERRDLVLAQMLEARAITRDQLDTAVATPIQVTGTLSDPSRRAPWMVDVAIDQLESRLSEGRLEGWQVHTHIQPLLQRAAEQAVARSMAELDADYPAAAGAQVALVAVRVEDGAVVAMVGGRDYAASPFNRATLAWRQPGSTVKPITALAAFDADPSLSPITTVLDEPIERSGWAPQNYDGTFVGELTLRQAMETSRNVPAVLLAEQVGLEHLKAFYEGCGLSQATSYHSMALGAFSATPLELASCYTVFPGGGSVAQPWLVRLAEADGVEEKWGARWVTLSAARSAALTTSLLEGVVHNGTGASARGYGVTGAVGGKTGTTNDYKDAWFVGFTPELAVAVWVGNDDGSPIGLAGSRGALPTWARFIAASGTQEGHFPLPAGMVKEKVCVESQQMAAKGCDLTYDELFTAGQVPDETCHLHRRPGSEIGRFFKGLFGRDSERKDGSRDEP